MISNNNSVSNIDNEKNENSNSNGVAIIGMAGRFPKAKDIYEFWRNLVEGKDCITFYTDRELEEAGIVPEVLKNPDYVKAKGELEGTDLFDASFFGINPREAELTDPQHRLLLECAWEAMEHAGYDSSKYNGAVGVFAGKSMDFYLILNVLPRVQKKITAGYLQAAIGNDKDSLTTTISYRLNLTGPGITIQTSSSTSLVAVCVACQSLLTYQCDMALAGGITAGPPIKSGYFYETDGIWSPDGHTRAFDAKGRGFVHANGMGMVVLKRLEDALTDGDKIWAVIRGFAVNNDGSKKVSYSAPSVDGQTEVITQALAMADVNPETIQFIETHGTATRLGDPIEMTGLIQAFRSYTEKKQFCAIGSVKTNIGHVDTAAGVVSLIKTALALHNKEIPASLYFEKPNPRIDFENSPFFVNTELQEWKTNGRGFPRRAGITSIGMGGTNAHVILEEAPIQEPSGSAREWQLILLSAKTETALEAKTNEILNFMKTQEDLVLPDLVYTLNVGRRDFNFRRMVLCETLEDAIHHMESRTPGRMIDSVCSDFSSPVIFLCTGAGSQYVNMGKELYQKESIFRENVDKCAAFLAPLLGIDLRSIIYPVEEDSGKSREQLNQTWLAHPALFVVEYSLSQMFMEWGINPAGLIGHSIGELAAACISGCFSLEDGLRLVAARSASMQTQEPGVMLAIHVKEANLMEVLAGWPDICLAAVNGPDFCVISGPIEAVERFKSLLNERHWVYRPLATTHAFHSRMMEPVMVEYEAVLKKVKLNAPRIPIISGVSGSWLTDEEAQNTQYWLEQLRQPVRFSQGIVKILENPSRVFLEIGPGNALCALAQQHKQDESRKAMFSSIRNADQKESDIAFLLKTLGKLWLSGVSTNWNNFYRDEKRHRIPLPTYPFERERYWLEGDKEIQPETRFKPRPEKELEIEKKEPTGPGTGMPSEFMSTSQEEKKELKNEEKETVKARPQLKTIYVPPNNELEKQITMIWEEILGIRPIGIEDNFFELGGHSLLATLFLSRLHEEIEVRLELKTIFENPTIAAIARLAFSEKNKSEEINDLESLLNEIEGLSQDDVQIALSEEK
ncbi:MAG: phthiocerol/phenolphthiocerol synthesis type-I polyketide synthase [Acidobacteriota bacterium]|nr:phthiocerol/phenolphthiocerol synthesis type-I polyketide synthase [Acidobacteriota bacterium]